MIKKSKKIVDEVKKQQALNENTKKVALERLLKEKARLDQKFAKETISPLSKTLRKRKEKLESKTKNSRILLAGQSYYNSGYASTLKKWIARYYTLPEIYDLRNSHIQAQIQMIIDNRGEIRKIILHKSSRDFLFDKLALSTIKKAAPFPKPPKEWVGKTITLPFETGNNSSN